MQLQNVKKVFSGKKKSTKYSFHMHELHYNVCTTLWYRSGSGCVSDVRIGKKKLKWTRKKNFREIFANFCQQVSSSWKLSLSESERDEGIF